MLIRPKDREKLIALISANIPEPVEVWAYGSRVNGAAHEASDIDLVIRSKDLRPVDWKAFTTLQQQIKDSNIPVLVDIKDWALLPATFHTEINKQFEVFYSTLNPSVVEISGTGNIR
jgi:predicted nucleotidyltransferase